MVEWNIIVKPGKKIVVSIFLLIIGLILLIGLIKIQGWKNILDALRGARVSWIAASVVVYYFGVLVRASKWHYLLGTLHHHIRFRDFVPLYLINSLAGTLTPTKSGESVFPFLLRRYLNSSIGGGFSIVFTDRLFELIVFILLMSVSTAYIAFSFNLPSIVFSTLVITFVILLAIVAILISVFFHRGTILAVSACLEKFAKNGGRLNFLRRALGRIAQGLGTFYEGLTLFNQKEVFIRIFFLTFCAWGFELSAYFLIAKSLVNISFFAFAPCYVITAGVAVVSFIPAGIGSTTVSFVYLLSLMGYSKTDSTAISLLGLSVSLSSLCFFTAFSYVLLRPGKTIKNELL